MRPPADFRKRTFLERVSLAAREPVYSAAFAWALGEHSPLPLRRRLAVVAALSGADTRGGRAIHATTEQHRVDILLEIERKGTPLHIAIENKIKSVEGKDQLASYDALLAQPSETVRKVFLTLTGEAPRSSPGWVPKAYSVLLDALSDAHSNDPYIIDLCGALARLVAVSDAARAEPSPVAAAAFHDHGAPVGDDIVSYVEDMRLNKVVQRIWMTELAAGLVVPSPWQRAIGETRGQALLEIEARLDDRPGYLVGLQLQRRKLKAFCKPFPYEKRASAHQHRTVEAILKRIRAAFGRGRSVELSRPRDRGFRSFRVDELPEGRQRDEWLAVLRPWLTKLVAIFPGVTERPG